MYPETVGRSLEEVEEIFQQGHVFTAWKIGKDIGKKTLAEVVEKSKAIPVRCFVKSFSCSGKHLLILFFLGREAVSISRRRKGFRMIFTLNVVLRVSLLFMSQIRV